MKQFLAIYKREFSAYFQTPIAIIFLTVFLILNGFFTFKLGHFYDNGQADLRAFFLWHPWLYLFLVPAISMRLWAEEKKSGTIELLLTLPVSLIEAVAGKFFAAWTFLLLALLLTFPIVITVQYLGEPDMGVIIAGYIGSFLMAGAFLAVSIAISASTNSQIVSFVISTVILLGLILLGFDPVTQMIGGVLPSVIADQLLNLSIPVHFEAIQRGVLDLRDLIYFTSIIVVGLIVSTIVLDKSRVG